MIFLTGISFFPSKLSIINDNILKLFLIDFFKFIANNSRQSKASVCAKTYPDMISNWNDRKVGNHDMLIKKPKDYCTLELAMSEENTKETL